MHGGSARQVREKAQQRMLALVHPALDTLRELVASADSDSVRMAAAKYVLEYAGFKVVEKVDVEQETVIKVIWQDVPHDYLQGVHTNGHTRAPA